MGTQVATRRYVVGIKVKPKKKRVAAHLWDKEVNQNYTLIRPEQKRKSVG